MDGHALHVLPDLLFLTEPTFGRHHTNSRLLVYMYRMKIVADGESGSHRRHRHKGYSDYYLGRYSKSGGPSKRAGWAWYFYGKQIARS